ncbi:MAG: D-alanyl-D-alanine carboxypeptidase/D-alanyl-D-alanine-endopeptidase [Deltaproteobacteria bacterium]|nr:D-alanyl-D-alanine carboxypeptidase/D-alanyl-D-alanine-endopeptidase [Deltaproteobacteria bacterium]
MPFFSHSAAADDLNERLNTALKHPGTRGATIGALVIDATDGQVLFERNPATPLAPASNQKILTALAAFATWGPAHRFTTGVLADAPIGSDGSVGTLIVRGGGDPALTSEELWRLAADLRRLGLRHVRGDLLLDDTYFDAEQWNPAWGEGTARAYHASVSALTANYGAFAVEIAPPPRPGGKPRVNVDPPTPFFQLEDRVRVGGDAPLAVERRANGDGERVTVGGSIRPGGDAVEVPRSVTDPVRYFGAVLRMQLAALGIQVDGATRVAATPSGSLELLSFTGRPLAEIAGLLMKYSNNNIAEMLVKGLGAQAGNSAGSWPSGLAVVRQQLAAQGVDQSGVTLVDGSGLAASNRVTARALVDALRAARASFRFGPEFVAALPIAGRDGTLKQRAAAAADAARAKTGLINGVATLSGYAHTRSHGDVVFALLNNGADAGAQPAIDANDAFLEALVR